MEDVGLRAINLRASIFAGDGIQNHRDCGCRSMPKLVAVGGGTGSTGGSGAPSAAGPNCLPRSLCGAPERTHVSSRSFNRSSSLKSFWTLPMTYRERVLVAYPDSTATDTQANTH